MGGGGEKEAKTRKRPPRQKKGAKGDLENTKTHPPKKHIQRKVPSWVRRKESKQEKGFQLIIPVTSPRKLSNQIAPF